MKPVSPALRWLPEANVESPALKKGGAFFLEIRFVGGDLFFIFFVNSSCEQSSEPSRFSKQKAETTMISNQLIDDMVSSIVHEIQPEKIYLFGSAVRGQMNDDSDVDLMIIESEPFDTNRSRYDELKRIRRAVSSYHAPKDILVYSQDEVRKWQHSINHIIGRCVREGRLLYARS